MDQTISFAEALAAVGLPVEDSFTSLLSARLSVSRERESIAAAESSRYTSSEALAFFAAPPRALAALAPYHHHTMITLYYNTYY